MKDYVIAAKHIDTFIELLTPEGAHMACQLLDEFWRNYCETDVRILWLIRYTKHNHGAKGAWANLDHKLRVRLKAWNMI